MKENRYKAQIQKLLELFNELFPFNSPLDQALSQLYRSNKSYGSKDRKFISGSLFGFARWYGWLNEIDADTSKKLLLGYLLDSNEITPLTVFWAESLELNLEFLKACECPDQFSLDKKLALIQTLNPKLELKHLNPEFTPEQPKEYFEFAQMRAPLWLRCREDKMGKIVTEFQTKDIPFKKHESFPNTLEVLTTPNLPSLEGFKKGYFQVQDISSQMVGYIMPMEPHQKWLDLCAGSGGKALHLAEKLNGTGRVFGLDIRQGTVNEGIKRVRKTRMRNIGLDVWDGRIFPVFDENFAGVLVDAPCSGSGTWRRAPDLRWRTSYEDVEKYQKLQGEILRKGATLVDSKGILAYVTCSIFPQENEGVIDSFLKDNSDYSLMPYKLPVSGEECNGSHLFTPQELNGVGLFITLMKRK
ncbi:MAG: RsmB/NOP family class I SAM-dependent RNA methyltransferase [SAR324 cluster bacterium]|nr:RsmB/NOP family class I SAM-dependent RNA methyltransferase [SAR324 cluster bacterium]